MDQVENELERLTEALFFRRTGSRPRLLLMVDLGGKESSIWLARGVAASLAESTGECVHLLSINNDGHPPPSTNPGPASDHKGYSFQTISSFQKDGGHARLVREKIKSLLAQGGTVIIHISEHAEKHLSFPHLNMMDGVVLLVRAAKTRREALRAIQSQLSAGVPPLLGSVLLDRP